MTEYVSKTAKKGTLIHNIIESHVTKTEVDLSEYTDEEILHAEKCFKKYLDWEEKHQLTPCFCEKSFVSEKYLYGGIIDFYCILDGKYTIVDFKTGKNVNHEQFLQVSSYVQLFLENGWPVDQILILNVPKDLEIPLTENYMNLDSAAYYFEMFKNLINVYYLKKELGWK